MSDTRTTIRNIDQTLYRRARVLAVENDIPVGELINHSLELFMNEAEFVDVETKEATNLAVA
ncbi:hypothetical protein [Roseobacter sp. MH60115]|uniref:hypothetical protein n=1 Tax=Roseobacter sp. MH60115 TaxID=2785324 RepID=UPI0018A288EA|nr:hypothetical protein [Roseobacter sp. MH60115]